MEVVHRPIYTASKKHSTNYHHHTFSSQHSKLLLNLPKMHRILTSLKIYLSSTSYQKKHLKAYESRNAKRKITFNAAAQDLTSQHYKPAIPTYKKKTHCSIVFADMTTLFLGLTPTSHSKLKMNFNSCSLLQFLTAVKTPMNFMPIENVLNLNY